MRKHLLAAFTIFYGTLSLSAQIPTNGLVSKWSFDSRITSNFTKDEQGSHPLTNNGALAYPRRSNVDTSVAFFTTGMSMSSNNSVFRANSFSIATWFNITNSTPFHTLASVRIQNSGAPYNSYNLNIGTSTSNKLTFFFSTTLGNDIQVQNPTSTNYSTWTHAVVTCNYNSTEDSTSVKMYVSGNLVAQTKVKSYIYYNPANNPLVLGSVTGAPNGNTLLGRLDDFMFYNRALTASEVTNMYFGIQTPTTGLISFWKFNSIRIEHDSQASFPLTNGGETPTIGISNIDSTAANFAGAGASMSVNNVAFRPASFSMATWFKITGNTPFHTLASVRIQNTGAPYNSYNLNTGSSTSNKLTFFFSTNMANDILVQNTATTTPNVWHHAAVSCNYNNTEDSSSVKLYMNGALVAQTKVKSQITYTTSNNPLVLGSVTGAPNGNSLIGSLDEFLYYNRALSPSEISSIYNGTTTNINHTILNQGEHINIYPNPTSSVLNIEVKEQTQISIINILGEVIKTETIIESSQVDVSNLNPGVYFIQDSKSGKAIKFIKE